MQYKLIFIFLISIFSFSFVFSQECYFGQQNSCETISSSFNTFNIQITPQEQLKGYSAELYNVANPSNKIKLEIEGNRIKNINPLTQLGIYALKIDAKNLAGISSTEIYEFVFDNLEPSPPVIPLKISGISSVSVEGFSNVGGIGYAQVRNNNPINSVINSDGIFFISLSGLSPGWNKVDFYVESHNGLKSQRVERLIYYGNSIEENSNFDVNAITLSSLKDVNSRTVKVGEVYTTTKRNFYVEGNLIGSRVKGVPVYVQGVKTLSDNSGRFGGFVLLNEGQNTIKIQAGDKEKSVEVFYTKLKFRFLEFDSSSKKVSTSSTIITGKVNLNVFFVLYVNGKLDSVVKDYTDNLDGTFSFSKSIVLNSRKNYIVLEGLNGEKLSKIIYLDSNKPSVEYVGRKNVMSTKNLAFKITDDTGIDNLTLNLNTSGRIYASNDFFQKGDYYLLNIDEGITSSSLSLSVSDTFSQRTNIVENINTNQNNVVFENISITNGISIGNDIFIKAGSQTISLKPSAPISFDHIYLDSNEISNYDIKADNSVEIPLDIIHENGTLNLIYYDSNLKKYEEKFRYTSDLETPKVNFDYIENPSTTNRAIKITGEIQSSYFDWKTFKINSQNVRRFGNSFEVDIIPTQDGFSNLNVEGRDLLGQELEPSILGSILFKDSTITTLNVGDISINAFRIILTNLDTRVNNYISSYDGFDMVRTFIGQTGFLATQQREGIRSINFRGIEDSSQGLVSKEIISVDATLPKVYLVHQLDKYKILIDGTLSEVQTPTIKVDNVEVQLSRCIEKIAVFSECYLIDNSTFLSVSVDVSDKAGNRVVQNIFKVDAVSFSDILPTVSHTEVFITGTDANVGTNTAIVQGQIKTNVPLRSVNLSDGTVCRFDDFNFVCLVNNLIVGKNNITVDVYSFKAIDSDEDGKSDYTDNCPGIKNRDQANLDRDEFGDACDPDIDGDGVDNDVDLCPYTEEGDNGDIDLDGIGDACDNDRDGDRINNSDDNCPGISNPLQLTPNSDGTCGDVDGDGVLDGGDNCPFVLNFNQANMNNDSIGDVLGDVCGDIDGDNSLDYQDNCPYVGNTHQRNKDGDSLGDVCDIDADNDGINNSYINITGGVVTFSKLDNCKLVYNPNQNNTDLNYEIAQGLDIKGDACDSDIDGDGVDNGLDLCPTQKNIGDTDGDGIDDVCDPLIDTDGDGIADSVDNCQYESNQDQNNTDLTYEIDNQLIQQGDVCDFDIDGDGINNGEDNCQFVPNFNQYDSDSDGLGNVCDGFNDDIDRDGVFNIFDNCQESYNPDQENHDGVGLGDACDDNDNDGVVYNNSYPINLSNRYTISIQRDNCPDVYNPDQANFDNDLLGDVCDYDDDNDGVEDNYTTNLGVLKIANVYDNCQFVYNANQSNIDNDSLGDVCDFDIDGDGINNSKDNCQFVPNTNQSNIDHDSLGDACDGTFSDTDLDGITDLTDNCVEIYNPDQEDHDGVGLGDACDDSDNDGVVYNNSYPKLSFNKYTRPIQRDNCPDITNRYQRDSDSDGVGDVCDYDDDNDGITDDYTIKLIGGEEKKIFNPTEYDNCQFVYNPDQNNTDLSYEIAQGLDIKGDACDPDIDGDGINNGEDNCRFEYNPLQEINNAVGLGDACDGVNDDIDNDGIKNGLDNCVESYNPGQNDISKDGIGDVCDDSDNDGIRDNLDLCIYVNITDQRDLDSDGIGDICDPDIDNDGINNSYINFVGENITFSPNDNCLYVPNPEQKNNDSDSLGDVCDFDDDNDGVGDNLTTKFGILRISSKYDNCHFVYNPDQNNTDLNDELAQGLDIKGDACDPDIDNDGKEYDSTYNFTDLCPYTKDGDNNDIDGDGLGDACDSDKDGDTINNIDDNCPGIPNPKQNNIIAPNKYGDVCDDIDSDGVPDSIDNCPLKSNPAQRNMNNDSIGDVCGDIDKDTVFDDRDNCLYVKNQNQANWDLNNLGSGKGDLLGNVCDFDDDNDGINDLYTNESGSFISEPKSKFDNCQYAPNHDQSDIDSDGKGDVCDTDKDGDGISNANDTFPLTYIKRPEINLNGILGQGVFKLNNKYHSVSPLVTLNVSLSSPSVVKVLVGGVEHLVNRRNGNFTVDLNFSSQVNGITEDQKEYKIYLEAENQLSKNNPSMSNPIILVYDRVLKAIVRIFVE